VVTLYANDEEELIAHQHESEYAALAGELSQCMQQVFRRVRCVHRERNRVPLTFFPPRRNDVVDPRLFHIPIVALHSLNDHYCAVMEILVVDHPLVAHKLGRLRAEDTSSATFRLLAEELVTLLAYEATENLDVVPIEITTPVATCTGVEIAEPKPLVVPILRAGLGMLNGMVKLMPTAEVGFLGMIRDEETLEATTYADRLPHDVSDRHVFLLDPMLATGGTLVAAIDLLLERGAKDVTAICLIASPEGIARLEAAYADRDVTVRVVTACVDERLNEVGYIVPGLGDAGDRLYGTV
jgi:uracil phosphoribosyltransferase